MRAVIRKRYGGPEVLTISEVARPTPSANEVLVKVHYTTINRTDCGTLTGKPFVFRFFIGFPNPKRPITGTDFSGEVVEVGKEVTRFEVGDRVFGLNDEGLSSHAEFMAISEDSAIVKLNTSVSLASAAASAEGPHYAINFLNKIKLQAGDKVLVNGATGGIGSAATQLLLNRGIHVTAVCDTKNISLIESLGVHEVINYETDDFTKRNEKFRFVLDAVGKSRFRYCKNILKPQGAYISSELGPRSENIFLALWTKFSKKQRVIFPLPVNVKRSVEHMSGLLEESKYTPLIDRIYPMTDVAEAFTYVQKGMKTGNVLLKIIE